MKLFELIQQLFLNFSQCLFLAAVVLTVPFGCRSGSPKLDSTL